MMMMVWTLSSNDRKREKKKKRLMGLACLSKEKRTEIARMGGLARAKKWREKREERKKIVEARNYTLTEFL
ncbi:MAG TPA: hypothetical protein VE544_12495 [Nitrososphaeraceae archaeon]|jgi:hypothetical protein|nr:hypothetical protein [Nitrososphaeraceae archaeon]